MTLAETAKAYRTQNYLTIAAAADIADVLDSTWRRMEDGELPGTTRALKQICRLLNYSADDALGLTETSGAFRA